MASGDPLHDRFLTAAKRQVEDLPYALDDAGLRALDRRIGRGVEVMRSEGRTGSEDVALAERHLRGLLVKAGARTLLTSSGEAVVSAEGLQSLSPSDKSWPF